MSLEIESLGSSSFDSFGFCSNEPAFQASYHESVYSPDPCIVSAKREASIRGAQSLDLDGRIGRLGKRIQPREGSGEVGFKAKWGDKDGVEISGYVKGEYHDDNGNYVKGQAEHKSDGTGEVSVSAGHKEDSK